MIKRILVGLGTSATAESVTRQAIDIAKPHSAELVGLAVTDQFRPIRRVLGAYSGSLESAKTFKSFVHSGLYADAAVRIVHFGDDAQAAARRLEKAAAFFTAHGRAAETDHAGGRADRDLLPYAEAWKADLIVAGNSARNLLLRRVFGETALRLLRESPLPLYLAQ